MADDQPSAPKKGLKALSLQSFFAVITVVPSGYDSPSHPW